MKEEIIVGGISILVGILMLIFRNSYAYRIIEFQNRVWGFHFGVAEIKISKVIIVIVGFGLIVLGILSLFQLIRFK